MNCQTLSDEKVLFEKRYCKGSQKSSCEVTVTNRRIVHSFCYKKGAETTEIKIDDINGCNLQMQKGSPLGTLLLVLGIWTLLGGIIGFAVNKFLVGGGSASFDGSFNNVVAPTPMVPFIIAFVVGLFAAIVGAILNRRIKLMIAVYIDAVENPMLFCSALTGKSKLIRLKVIRSAAREIVSDLTAAIANAKENK